MIDFFKQSIENHPEWKDAFDWSFSSTESYQDISSFYREVEQQGYKIKFSQIPQVCIDKMVADNKLYLFQIYSKDFSTKKNKKGTDNIHTLYWKGLFKEENLKNTILKLDGGAELFYRKASIKYSQEKRQKGHHAKELEGKFDYPIIKDKRYSEDKILFHCPITINFKAAKQENINKQIQSFIKKNYQDINIIGIDRGERNLLYYTVINQKGDILEQKSWNTIDTGFKPKGESKTKVIDYQFILDKKEKQRAKARLDWDSIESIKELKTGYLSQIVHQLSELIIKYNAIVVLEDLNFGFKRGRFKVEKQIYQKFEKALIDKLNYLVNKKETNPLQAGHYLNGYQLASKFKSFQKLGTQSGILFYTTASYTSKIDPITGYIQNLYPKYQDSKQAQNFFAKFDSIIFNGEYFEFTYNLKNLKGLTGSYDDKKELDETKLDHSWTIHSKVERSTYDKSQGHLITDINEELIKLFKDQNISLEKGLDIQKIICDKTKKEHYQSSRFLAKVMARFTRLLNMRVTDTKKAEKRILTDGNGNERTFFSHNKDSDFIVSPVYPFFDSRKVTKEMKLPEDSDANGAYNIARKGIILINSLVKDTKPKLSPSKQEWQEYAQNSDIVNRQRNKWNK